MFDKKFNLSRFFNALLFFGKMLTKFVANFVPFQEASVFFYSQEIFLILLNYFNSKKLHFNTLLVLELLGSNFQQFIITLKLKQTKITFPLFN